MNDDEFITIDRITILSGNNHIKLTIPEARSLFKELSGIVGPHSDAPPLVKVNPNHEPWPDHWFISYGMLRQGNELVVNL